MISQPSNISSIPIKIITYFKFQKQDIDGPFWEKALKEFYLITSYKNIELDSYFWKVNYAMKIL